MDKKDFVIILSMCLVAGGWISWVMTRYEDPRRPAPQTHEGHTMYSAAPLQTLPLENSPDSSPPAAPDSLDAVSSQTVSVSLGGSAADDSGSFPPPTVEIVNGRAERTIHMGVRQYAWDPSTLTVKQGELVRLIIHNADVQHGLVIPELGVLNIDIPPEGAVIEFEAHKAGTFDFFCSYYCGEGHSEMRGKIIVEE